MEDKDALNWEALQSHGIPVTVVGPSTNVWRVPFTTCRILLKTHLWGRTNATSRHRGLGRFAAGLVARAGSRKQGMIIRVNLIKKMGCEWDIHWGRVAWMWARVRRASGSWKRAMWWGQEVREQSYNLSWYSQSHAFFLEKNQLSLILITEVVHIYCRTSRKLLDELKKIFLS